MGKNPDPSSEDLELIFKGFAEGKDDKAIIEDIEDNLTTPRNSRFVRQRRLHWEDAKKILEAKLKHDIDPLILEQKREHFRKFTDTAQILLSNGINHAARIYLPEDKEHKDPHYVVLSYHPEIAIEEDLGMRGLCERLTANLGLCYDKHGQTQVNEHFLPHWNAQTKVEYQSLEEIIEKAPMEFIENLKVFASRGVYEGKCPVCKDW